METSEYLEAANWVDNIEYGWLMIPTKRKQENPRL